MYLLKYVRICTWIFGCRDVLVGTWLRSARLLPLPSRRGPSKLVSAFLLQGTTSVGFDSSIVDCLLLPGEMEPLDSAGT